MSLKLERETVEAIKTYEHAILSFIGREGYPVTLRLPYRVNERENTIEMPKPAGAPESVGKDRKATVFFHYHDDKVANMRQLAFTGLLDERGDALVFTPTGQYLFLDPRKPETARLRQQRAEWYLEKHHRK